MILFPVMGILTLINQRLQSKIDNFDVFSYLDESGIRYKILSDNILINCLYCDDYKFKAGIHKNKKVFNCFKCGTKGNLIRLISKISSCSFFEAENIIKSNGSETYEEIENIENEIEKLLSGSIQEGSKVSEIDIPASVSLKRLVSVYKRIFHGYLKTRNFFDLDYLQEMGITACLSGYYKNRLIIPVYYQNKMVSFLTRDVTNKADAKYKNLPANKSMLTVKEVLFGYDTCMYGDTIILVEGSFDWLRVYSAIREVEDYSALAVLGKSVTIPQQIILQRLSPKKVIIFFDSGTQEDSEKLKMSLSPFVDDVSIIDGLRDGCDPADLCEDEILGILGIEK